MTVPLRLNINSVRLIWCIIGFGSVVFCLIWWFDIIFVWLIDMGLLIEIWLKTVSRSFRVLELRLYFFEFEKFMINKALLILVFGKLKILKREISLCFWFGNRTVVKALWEVLGNREKELVWWRFTTLIIMVLPRKMLTMHLLNYIEKSIRIAPLLICTNRKMRFKQSGINDSFEFPWVKIQDTKLGSNLFKSRINWVLEIKAIKLFEIVSSRGNL